MARLLQLAGILLAVIGIAGYWLSVDVPRSEISDTTRLILNVPEKLEPISFVLAGRDRLAIRNAGSNRLVNGRCVPAQAGEFVTSARTDTIIFVTIIGTEISMINLPRDIYIPKLDSKLNAVRAYTGAAGLKDTVSEILGIPIDYYAIVNLGLFERLVDAIGGVDVNVPYIMKYQDCADGLEIDFEPGPTHMTGADASGFVRYRDTALADIDRLDNVKRLSYAILARLKELNFRAVSRLPALIDTYFDEVETNVTPALLYELLPRVAQLQITRSASLPYCCVERIVVRGEETEVIGYDGRQVTAFLADLFSGEAPEFTELPDTQLLITNQSGLPELAARVIERLVAMGFAAANLSERTQDATTGPSIVLATSKETASARIFADLFNLPLQELARLDADSAVVELVLTTEAAAFALAADLPADEACNLEADAGLCPQPGTDR